MTGPIEVVAPDQMGLGDSFQVNELKVRSDSEVRVGDIIAELESDVAILEMESFDSGLIRWVASKGDVVQPGQLIANIFCDGEPQQCSVRINLSTEQTLALDSARGELSRADYLVSLIPKN